MSLVEANIAALRARQQQTSVDERAGLGTFVAERAAGSDVFANRDAFEHAQRVAKVFAGSQLVPQHLRDKTADCVILYHLARRLGEDPLTLMQQTYVVSGRAGFFTSYLIARARSAKVFRGPVTWRTTGANGELAVTAVALLADTGEEVTATTDMRMAKAEGWTRNAKYASMPEHMLRWRSAAMLIRLYAPEVMLGMPVVEEIETMAPPPVMRDVTPPRSVTAALDAFAATPAAAPSTDDGVAQAAPTTEQEVAQPEPEPQRLPFADWQRLILQVLEDAEDAAMLREWWDGDASQESYIAYLHEVGTPATALRDKVLLRIAELEGAAPGGRGKR